LKQLCRALDDAGLATLGFLGDDFSADLFHCANRRGNVSVDVLRYFHELDGITTGE